MKLTSTLPKRIVQHMRQRTRSTLKGRGWVELTVRGGHGFENSEHEGLGDLIGVHASIHGDQEKALILVTIPPPVNDVAFEWFSFFCFGLFSCCVSALSFLIVKCASRANVREVNGNEWF